MEEINNIKTPVENNHISSTPHNVTEDVVGDAIVNTATQEASDKPSDIIVQSALKGDLVNPAEFKSLQLVVVAIAAVAVVAFITLILQYFSATQSSYQNLVNQITTQNAKIDTFENVLNKATEYNVKISDFQSLSNQVTAQNAKIDTLIQLKAK